MKHVGKECRHCGSDYNYYMSGNPGYPSRLIDDRYCPDCMTVMLAALDKVPVKFEYRWVDASDKITLQELLTAEANHSGSRRVFSGLMDDGDSSSSRTVNKFVLTTWDHNPEYSIGESKRYDLINKKFVDGNEYNQPKKLIDKSKVSSYKKWKKTRGEPKEPEIIPMDKPIGLFAVVRGFINGGTDDVGPF